MSLTACCRAPRGEPFETRWAGIVFSTSPRQKTRRGQPSRPLGYGNGSTAVASHFKSPCSCRDNDGKGRLSAKKDPSLPPTDASASPGGRYHGGASLSAVFGL